MAHRMVTQLWPQLASVPILPFFEHSSERHRSSEFTAVSLPGQVDIYIYAVI